MPDNRESQLLKGVLPMLLLALLSREESYGYELVVRLQDAGLAGIAAGTVYPVLTRLERERLISSRLVPSRSGPARKYYRPTDAGSDALAESAAAWRALARTVEPLLHATPPREDDR
ncbi:MAG: PadR family transcriptional regulator [Propionibacteriaceae bacterium]|nr:PadR family transcriptional regulator [Propionibacteriaceae bacterium]